MEIIDHPRFIERSDYDRAISQMVDRLAFVKGVRAIYQIGGTSNPGISDVDLVVVFAAGVKCLYSPRQELTPDERYLFTHSVFGANDQDFVDALRYSFFHNYRLLYGEPCHDKSACDTTAIRLRAADVETLKRQLAIEYLIRMYITMAVECSIRIIKLRNLLLNAKALGYDLEFLNVGGGKLFELVNQVVAWRNQWFREQVATPTIIAWFREFHIELEAFLQAELGNEPMCVPADGVHKITKNITLFPASEMTWSRRGFLMPRIPGLTRRRFISVLHRLNRFEFGVPMEGNNVPEIIQDSFAHRRRMSHYNLKHLPHFMPLTSSLNIISA